MTVNPDTIGDLAALADLRDEAHRSYERALWSISGTVGCPRCGVASGNLCKQTVAGRDYALMNAGHSARLKAAGILRRPTLK